MPELPEVEVIRQFLDQKIKGLIVAKIDILTPKSFIGNPEQAKRVEGQKIISISRIGKQLSLILDNNLILLFHLKMTGQIIFSPLSPCPPVAEKRGSRGDFVFGHPTPFRSLGEGWPNKSTRLVLKLSPPACPPSGGSREGRGESFLFFNDQRKFGWVKLLSPDELAKSQSNLGLDIFSPKFSPKYFFAQLQRSSAPVKTVLLDQSKFAGIGNIYANDALFLSGIHPSTPSRQISRSKALSLFRSLLSIMHQSVLAGGSTAKDNGYIKPDGSKGSNQFHFRVYQRAGQPCPKCKTPIVYTKVGGRGTFFCPKCQKE
ncbi:MAG: bifunctional DNA-formamidopyrimidine glycosylase/DNA-(apurinic or apyrimidinic site) lyase [Candidatus Shapirobacteria bacterium]|jgi:formamidopyrimidine-DNA glycosylase